MSTTPGNTEATRQKAAPGSGLAGRILVLTIAFVMLAEVAIYIPSVANYRNNLLRDRLSAAYTAALVLEAAPADAIPDQLKSDLLESVGAMSIALKTRDARRLLAVADMPAVMHERFDLRSASPWQSIRGAFATLLSPTPRTLLVIGAAPRGAEFIEITMHDSALRTAMWRYSFNILMLSLIISGIVAGLAVLALHLLVLRPVRRLTRSLIEFRDDPEDAARVIEPSGSRHEIGVAEEALAQTQRALLQALREKKHLAALGLAVAKINHDLRNLLSTAQLLSDRLAAAPDGLARSVAPKLVGTLDRAIAFCQATLTYGRAAEPAPQPRPFAVRDMVAEAIEVVTPGASGIEIVNEAGDLIVVADREQMFRVLMNLLRNALDALTAAGAQPGQSPRVRVGAERSGGGFLIEVSDNGPGVPERARANLFQAFLGAARPGGNGLGLAIAAELVTAHGGEITLAEKGADGGATFRIRLPDPQARAERLRADAAG